MVWSPDGKTLASASNDNTVKIWKIGLDDLLLRGCSWVKDYLAYKSNIKLSKEDRKLCDSILSDATKSD